MQTSFNRRLFAPSFHPQDDIKIDQANQASFDIVLNLVPCRGPQNCAGFAEVFKDSKHVDAAFQAVEEE